MHLHILNDYKSEARSFLLFSFRTTCQNITRQNPTWHNKHTIVKAKGWFVIKNPGYLETLCKKNFYHCVRYF